MVTHREFSASVFNNRYALEVMVRIAMWPEETMYVRELVRQLPGLTDNDVRPVIRRLETAELLKEVGRGSYGSIHFGKVNRADRFWSAIADIGAQYGVRDSED